MQEIHATLFPEEVEEALRFEESYEEDIERMRHLYSVLMSEEELDMHFPCPLEGEVFKSTFSQNVKNAHGRTIKHLIIG